MDLSKFPRKKYTHGSTPIEPMSSLSKILGGDVNLWIKRDDQLGLTGGGNKTRKLEFVMADAVSRGADTIITYGAVQSNHCRLTLSACVKEGLSCCLIVEERVKGSYKEDASGNNYLFRLLGAESIERVDSGQAPAAAEKLAEKLRTEGRNVYVIPGGASDVVGAKGYLACAAEIHHQQFVEQFPKFDALITASGSGGTHAGLAAGMFALRSPTQVIGVSTRFDSTTQTGRIRSLAEKLLVNIGIPDLLPNDAVAVDDAYVGEGYSLPTKGMEEAVTLFARTEGILLDPVYSGKAAAGLIGMVRNGSFPAGSNVLFLHTGGAPSLYHYQPIGHSTAGTAKSKRSAEANSDMNTAEIEEKKID
mmetsp:Transcript_138/g.193  ORF Transcript_138/g.193 Transcript_138/m.193 type:complete len:362 (-) Transcript_138:214-1299(-)